MLSATQITSGTTKQTLVLLHGAGCTKHVWPKIPPPAFTQNNSTHSQQSPGIVAIDLPGHGDSEQSTDMSMDGYTKAVWSWIQQQGFENLYLCGHSMGGAIAQQLTYLYPTQIKGAVLLNTGAKLKTNPDFIEQISKVHSRQQAIDSIIKLSTFNTENTTASNTVADMFNNTKPEVLLQDLRNCNQIDNMEHIKDIHIPALIITGDHDQLALPHYSDYLHQHIKNSQLKIFDQCGHFSMLEYPKQFWDAIFAWLNGLE